MSWKVQKSPSKKDLARQAYERTKRAWRKRPENQKCCVKNCGRPAEPSPHHKRGRLGSLLCDTRFWLPVCRRHHNWIHANIAKARKLDLIAKPGEWNKAPNEEEAWDDRMVPFGDKCPHGNEWFDCDACMHASDIAYDIARETRIFGR